MIVWTREDDEWMSDAEHAKREAARKVCKHKWEARSTLIIPWLGIPHTRNYDKCSICGKEK
jgi:hypothetical protein